MLVEASEVVEAAEATEVNEAAALQTSLIFF